jgi:hypothetical protein
VVRRERALAATLVSASLLGLSLAGCEGLLGLKDLQPYPADGSTESGSEGGELADGMSGGDSVQPPADGSNPHDATSPSDGSTNDSAFPPDAPESDGPTKDAPADGPCTANTMTDGKNCGTCGHDCLGGACQLGVCQPFALASSVTAYDMVVSNGTLYWVDQISTSGSVWKCAIANSACTPTPLAGSQNGPSRIAIHGSNVYWSDYGSGTANDGAILSVPVSGGTPNPLVTGLGAPQGVATDGTYVYWAESYPESPAMAQIGRIALSGGSTTSIPMVAGSAPTAVAASTNEVYWTDVASGGNDGTVNKAPEPAQSPTGSVATSQTLPTALSLDSTYLYWVDFTIPGAVWQYDIASNSKTQLASTESNPFRIVSDDNDVFWIDQGTGTDGSLVRWHLGTSTKTSFPTNLALPSAVAMDGTAVYFATAGTGVLYMMAR